MDDGLVCTAVEMESMVRGYCSCIMASAPMKLSSKQQRDLEAIVARRAAPAGLVRRARVILLCAPPAGRSRWTTRLLAKEVELTSGCISDILRRDELRPHLTRTYKGKPWSARNCRYRSEVVAYAALEVATGKVTHRVTERHTAADFIAFMKKVVKAYMNGWNQNPTPFEWTKPAKAIIRARKRMLDRISTAVHWRAKP